MVQIVPPAAVVTLLLALAVPGAAMANSLPGPAAPAGEAGLAQGGAIEASSQARRRPPTRLRVTPRRRDGNTPYPRPNAVGYPGPGAKRECVARYVEERRPSGTVIVPRMNCWWVGG